MTLKAVLFDVDFTLVRPGPELGPDGYVRLARRHGLELDASRYAEARATALETVRRHKGERIPSWNARPLSPTGGTAPGCCAATVDDCQGMFSRSAHIPVNVAALYPGPLD